MSGKVEKIYKVGKNIWAILFGVLSVFLTFITWDDIGVKDACVKSLYFCRLFYVWLYCQYL